MSAKLNNKLTEAEFDAHNICALKMLLYCGAYYYTTTSLIEEVAREGRCKGTLKHILFNLRHRSEKIYEFIYTRILGRDPEDAELLQNAAVGRAYYLYEMGIAKSGHFGSGKYYQILVALSKLIKENNEVLLEEFKFTKATTLYNTEDLLKRLLPHIVDNRVYLVMKNITITDGVAL